MVLLGWVSPLTYRVGLGVQSGMIANMAPRAYLLCMRSSIQRGLGWSLTSSFLKILRFPKHCETLSIRDIGCGGQHFWLWWAWLGHANSQGVKFKVFTLSTVRVSSS